MTQADYDVLIVGARCAGATLATFLARAGASVLLLDQDRLPSDQVLSTHTIHPPGIEVLDEVGVGDAVRQVAPPGRIIRLNKDGAAVDFEFAEGRAEYCPRRRRLDGLLEEAAVSAGAELRDRTRVTELLREEDRVCGVRTLSEGREREFRAPLVIGADGRHSTVARLTQAREYLVYDAPRAMYWAYWDAPDFWMTDPAYPFDFYIGHVGESIRSIFPTDNNQLLIGSLPPISEVQHWRSNPLAALKADLAADPLTGGLIEGREPDGKVRGAVKERYFFREGAGPGWALVGDAGHHKEFVIGDGITEALLQARSLADAISEGSDRALLRWWRARDVEALPLYFFGQDEGALGAPPELQRIVFSRVAQSPLLRKRMTRIVEHQQSPYELLPAGKVFLWALSAALGGRWRVLKEFLAMGRRASQVNREWTRRKKLLAELDGLPKGPTRSAGGAR